MATCIVFRSVFLGLLDSSEGMGEAQSWDWLGAQELTTLLDPEDAWVRAKHPFRDS